jgi:hypothetical protein
VVISYWVIARVSERLPQLFSSVLGYRDAVVTARASTGVRQASSGGCVFAMNPTASGSMYLNGSTLLETGCGVFVNSNNPTAVNMVGGGTINTTGDARTQIVGNWNGGGTITPAPQTGMPVGYDPFYDMDPPAYGACTSTGISLGSHANRNINPTGDGVTCGDIYLASQSRLNLAPGVYVITGSLTLAGQAEISGTGVTIYIVNGGVTMAGGTAVNLTAPTSGPWQGILMYQRRGNTTPSNLVGGAGQAVSGVLYFPSAQLGFTGGSSTNATATTIVADTVQLDGNSYISASATTQFTGITGGVFLIE